MIRPIIRDILFLGQKSSPATRADIPVGDDLLDTLKANTDRCVGMAANMIGFHKNIIVIDTGLLKQVMYNPIITKKSGPYETEEGCLSLDGVRPATRYREITVRFQDREFKWHTVRYTGFPAQIIQHEIDHLNGIII